MAFDLHVFKNKSGGLSVSVTDEDGVRSKSIALNSVMKSTLLKIARDAYGTGRADGKDRGCDDGSHSTV